MKKYFYAGQLITIETVQSYTYQMNITFVSKNFITGFDIESNNKVTIYGQTFKEFNDDNDELETLFIFDTNILNIVNTTKIINF